MCASLIKYSYVTTFCLEAQEFQIREIDHLSPEIPNPGIRETNTPN